MKPATPEEASVALPSHPKYLPLVRAGVEQSAEMAGFRGEEAHRILLAVTEGVPNVIRPGYQGRTGRRRVRDMQPLDAIHIDLFTASAETRRLSAWHIIGVAGVDDAVPRLPFFLHELKGAGANDLLDLLIG